MALHPVIAAVAPACNASVGSGRCAVVPDVLTYPLPSRLGALDGGHAAGDIACYEANGRPQCPSPSRGVSLAISFGSPALLVMLFGRKVWTIMARNSKTCCYESKVNQSQTRECSG